jgi:hypothetical protein
MFEALKKWLGSAPAAAAAVTRDRAPVQAWAEARQAVFRASPKGDGFQIDGRLGATPWRIEWGPSQRSYLQGMELRLRSEPGVPGEMQLLLLNRGLQQALEKAVFDEYVETVQTRIDTQTPPEMRWLVMFSKLSGSELGPLRERYAAVASHKPWMQRWLAGSFADDLRAAPGAADDPLVLMVGRGRLMLRTSLAEAKPETLTPWLALFESAIRHARRVQDEIGEAPSASTQPSLWSASAMPGDPPAPPPRS